MRRTLAHASLPSAALPNALRANDSTAHVRQVPLGRGSRALIGAALLAVSCGGPPAPVAPPSAEAIVDEAAGTQIVVLPRATDGRVWLSLWIDAGARDADPPQLATVAAWTAAGEAPVDARVLPDGVELSRPCTRDQLDVCLRSLAQTVGAREPSGAAMGRAMERLGQARRRAAADDARRADALAMEALLGRSVDPLGAADGDALVDAPRVGAFLTAHAGAGRLLLVVVGDVEPSAVRRGVVTAFAGVPAARARRAERGVRGERAVRVAIADHSLVAAATLRPSVTDATHLARQLLVRVEADLPGTRASAEAFPLRGGAAMIARVHGEHEAGARVLLDHLSELADEPPVAPADPPPPEDGPRALARWIGARWCARQEQPARGGIGVGALVAGGRADRIDDDPDAETREAATRAITGALTSARAPRMEAIGPDGGDARVQGGASLRARRLPGATRFTVVVLFEGGASEDPPSTHGATALLAEIAQEGCETIAEGQLGHTLASLGVEATAVLTAGAWGLRVEGPTERWREVSFLAPRCASVPSLEPALVERARDAVLARARSQPARAAAAAMIAPASPGRVAPGGSPHAVAGLDPRALRRAHGVRVGAARARIAAAGDVSMDRAAAILARGAARWPAGLRAEPGPWLEASERLAGAAAPRHEAVIAWMIEAPASTGVAAAAFARAAARALAAEPGLSERWSDGGALDGRAWALVAVGATPDTLDALPAHVARALRTIAHAWPQVASGALADASERRAWAQSSPRSVAMTLSLEPAPPASLEELRRQVERLAESPPFYLVLRPAPGRR